MQVIDSRITAAQVSSDGLLELGNGIRVEANPHIYRTLPTISRRWWTTSKGPAKERWRVTNHSRVLFSTQSFRKAMSFAARESSRVSNEIKAYKQRLRSAAPELLMHCQEACQLLAKKKPVGRKDRELMITRLKNVIKLVDLEWKL